MSNSNKQTIRISVVIPAYNAAEHIGRAIDSVLGQTLAAEEIIVIDDGSTDCTGNIIKKYGGKIKYIRQKNRGVSAARNLGVAVAQFEWIAFLDADDEWLPDKLKLQTDILRHHSELKWVSGNYTRCLCNEKKKQNAIAPEKIKSKLHNGKVLENYFEMFTTGAIICSDVPLIKKTAFEEAGGFIEGIQTAEDIDLWFRIAYRHSRLGYVYTPVAIYHINNTNSLSGQDNIKQLCEFIEKHFQLSQKYKKESDFMHNAEHIVSRRIRGLLFANRPEEIQTLLLRCGKCLHWRFRLLIRMLMIWPWMTAKLCHGISRTVRIFKLRKTLVAKPEKITKT